MISTSWNPNLSNYKYEYCIACLCKVYLDLELNQTVKLNQSTAQNYKRLKRALYWGLFRSSQLLQSWESV